MCFKDGRFDGGELGRLDRALLGSVIWPDKGPLPGALLGLIDAVWLGVSDGPEHGTTEALALGIPLDLDQCTVLGAAVGI